MAYAEVQHIAGDYLRVHIYPFFQRNAQRGIRRESTKAAQKKYNEKLAIHRLTDTIHLNFDRTSVAVRLDYAKFYDRNGRNPSEEEVRKSMRNYLLRLKRIYRRAEIEMKYIYNVEVGKISGKVHHHLILTGGIDRDLIEQTWEHGYGNTRRLQFGTRGVEGLAHYMSKEPMTKKMWYGSRNLIKPTKEGKHPNIRSNHTRLSARQVRYIYENPEDFAEIRKLYPGYEVADAECSRMTDETTGEVFLNPYGIFITLYLYKRCTKLF